MFFDDYAKKWDTDRRINRAKIISDEIANSIDINKGCSAMEFGCGTGLISFNLVEKFENITLIDSSRGMIDVVKEKIEKYEVDNMKPYALDIFDEEIIETFDVIYTSMVLHHIQDISGLANKFYALLNDGGQVIIVDLDKEDGSFHKNEPGFNGHNGFDQEKLKKIFLEAGFKAVESNTFFYDEKKIEGKNIKYSLFIMKAKKHLDSEI
ncbi:class I SAM-dependent methyltransferase [Clostridium intestinale]|uniref:Class I SAM-dependent methyltransferase n=1 Tax=Clostridium intestinale TaxID=36845 RepID=A0A7D6VMX8_9CLOT|nr:class I SAM-dependent methyltransferase [Clostridium intestinale]QLY78447.1 class I SAM-dependent methyltransferase [Clostridium intestinale]